MIAPQHFRQRATRRSRKKTNKKKANIYIFPQVNIVCFAGCVCLFLCAISNMFCCNCFFISVVVAQFDFFLLSFPLRQQRWTVETLCCVVERLCLSNLFIISVCSRLDTVPTFLCIWWNGFFFVCRVCDWVDKTAIWSKSNRGAKQSVCGMG